VNHQLLISPPKWLLNDCLFRDIGQLFKNDSSTEVTIVEIYEIFIDPLELACSQIGI